MKVDARIPEKKENNMLAISLLIAFFTPFISRVFWKSFDQVSDAELRLMDLLPETAQMIVSGLIWAGAIAFGLYTIADLPIDLASGIAIAVTSVLLRLPMNTFDSRLVARLFVWFYSRAVSLKTRYTR